MVENEQVNHPAHYNQGAIECIDAIEAALGPAGFTAFLRGQVIKYQWRLGRKDAAAQDAAKAVWYAERLASVLHSRLQQILADPDAAGTEKPDDLAPVCGPDASDPAR